MSRTMIAALTLAAVAACGRGNGGDTAAADSLSRDLQLAPVDTTVPLNDRPTASAPAPAAKTPTRPSRRPAASPSSASSSPSAAGERSATGRKDPDSAEPSCRVTQYHTTALVRRCPIGPGREPEPVERRHHQRFDHGRDQLRQEQGG